MDKLLYSFVSNNINKMDQVKLLSLEKFLDIEDEKLYRFYNNIDQDLHFEDEYILNLFKKFKFNNK